MTPADQIYSLPTAVGTAKMTYGQANNLPVQISHMAIGDGNGAIVSPGAGALALVHEVYRAQLNQLYQHETNPNWLVAELVIPAEVGGFTIRELGLYDAAGDLIYVGNHAEQYKPVQSQGSDETKTIRMVILTSSTSAVTLKTDPTVVMATIDYVDRSIAKLDQKPSVRYTTTAAIGLAGLAVQAGGDWTGALTTGDRVLVKNQAAGKDNGIYAAAAGAWLRVADADGSVEVTSGLVVAVEQGATLADTRWQLVTDGAIVLGTTALVFQNVTQGFAPLASPIFSDNPRAPTPAQFDNDTSLATTEFVQRALGNFAGILVVSEAGIIAASSSGKAVILDGVAGAVFLPLAGDVPSGTTLNISAKQNGWTVSSSGGQKIDTTSSLITSFAMGAGDNVELVSNGFNSWTMAGGVSQSKYAAAFGSALAPFGFQKLPNGWALQWGVLADSAWAAGVFRTISYPLDFTGGVFQSGATLSNSAGTLGRVNTNQLSSSQIQLMVDYAGAATVRYFAIGRIL